MIQLMEKLPPQALEAEMAVLGSMMIQRDAIVNTIDQLKETSFYKEAHRKIYSAILHLYMQDRAVDLVTMTEELKRRKILTDVGGVGYLTELINMVSTTANVEHYAKIVRHKAVLRHLIQSATQICNDCYAETDTVEKILDKAEGTIFSIAQDKVAKGFSAAHEMIHNVIETVESYYQRKEHITGISTGFKEFDVLTAGLQPANLVIIAGRPAMGKTSIVMNIVEHAAIQEKIPVGLFSLEMAKQELILRMLCSQARVNAHEVRRGYLSKRYWTALTNAASRISEAPLYIDDSSSLSVLEMRARARRLAAELSLQGKKLGLIVVDYLQLMHSTGRSESRQQEISEISRSLKGLARDLNIPVIAISQLSRRPEEKGREGRPQLSDLRESGALEQDADLVAFIFREEIYKQDDPSLQGRAKLIIAKQRNGPVGEIELVFIKEYTRFENPVRAEA
ncbi:MAG: replicative DNA helicase [Elusimicrobia bacterium]|nr:replicative DNA helicase [Elusimicrobiota bacterium]MBD3412011.1 replicative DNA helicase [Elusimicrobiota bacterium]